KMGQFVEHIEVEISKEKYAIDKLHKLIEMHISQLANDHHLAVVTQLELRQTNKVLRNQINHILKPYLTIIDSIIQEGIKEHVFRSNLNTTLVRQMIFGTIDESVTTWVMKEHKYNLLTQVTEIHSLLVNGLIHQD